MTVNYLPECFSVVLIITMTITMIINDDDDDDDDDNNDNIDNSTSTEYFRWFVSKTCSIYCICSYVHLSMLRT